ncbi:hypothetical protein E4U51_005039 [Claviceps purpurea]|nr:hypothetical protein E4U51_005039 [Claviceps purpurea]
MAPPGNGATNQAETRYHGNMQEHHLPDHHLPEHLLLEHLLLEHPLPEHLLPPPASLEHLLLLASLCLLVSLASLELSLPALSLEPLWSLRLPARPTLVWAH